MEEPNGEKKYHVRMRKKLNNVSKTWRGVMMLQMEGFLVGSRKVQKRNQKKDSVNGAKMEPLQQSITLCVAAELPRKNT